MPQQPWDVQIHNLAEEYRIAQQQARDLRAAAERQAVLDADAAKRRAADEKSGFRYISLSDLDLDKKTIPGAKTLVVKGIYYVIGRQEWLGMIPFSAEAPRIGLITEDAPREARAVIQRCRLGTMCAITIVGHLGNCEETFAGTPYAAERCLFVTGIK